MGSDCSRLGKSYDQIYLPADCFRQCHAGDRCFCGSRHRSRKWMYVERGGDGREYFHDPMNYMDGFMMGGANGLGSGPLGGNGGGSLFPPGIIQSPDNWRLKDFERLNQVLLEYWNRLRGQQMVMAPCLGGGGLGRGGPLMPSWTMGAPGMNFGDMMGAGCNMGASPLRRGRRFGGGWTGDYGTWEDEMTQRMKRMEEIAKDYEDRVRGISDHLYGSTAERQEEMYRKRQQQMWQDFMQGQQTQNPMGMNGLGGMGGGMAGMNGLAQMMPMQGLASGMNPMMAGMGGLGGMLNPLQMGALGGMGANPLMGGAGLGGGGGLDEDRPNRRRRLGSRRRNSMFQDDDDDDDDILPRRRFGRRRRGGFGDDDDDLFPGRFGEDPFSPRRRRGGGGGGGGYRPPRRPYRPDGPLGNGGGVDLPFRPRQHDPFLQPTRPPSPTFTDNPDTIPPLATPRPTFTSPPFPRSPPPIHPSTARPFMDTPLDDNYPTNPPPGGFHRPASRFPTHNPPLDPLTPTVPGIPKDIYPDPNLQAADTPPLGGGDIPHNPPISMPMPEPGPISIPTVGRAAPAPGRRGIAPEDPTFPIPPTLPPKPSTSRLKKSVSFQGETRHLTRPRREEEDRGEGEAGAEPGARDLR